MQTNHFESDSEEPAQRASRRTHAMNPALFLSADLPGPSGERNHQIANEAARRLVDEITLGVEFGLRLADQHFGLVERMHVEKDAAAPQIVLRPGAACHPSRGANDRAGLAG